MSLSFVGQYHDRDWIETGLTSLDIACGKVNRLTGEVTLGIPTRIGIHWYGLYKIGKTTTALSLAAILAEKMGKTILHVPIDTFDDQALDILEFCGLTKDPYIVAEVEDFKSLDKSVEMFAGDKIGVAILDSVMAVSPVAEQKGSVNDAVMGRRASLVGKWVKKMYPLTKHSKQQKIFIAVNHVFSNVGGIPGFHTVGGNTIQAYTSIHVRLQQGRKGMKPITFEGARLLIGKVEKANFGPDGKQFNLFVIGGLGIHRGLTAVYDCLMYGLAEEKKEGDKKNSKEYLYLLDNKMGTVKDLYADFQNEALFEPFYTALADHKQGLVNWKPKPKAKPKKEEIDDDDESEEEVDLEKVDSDYES